MEFPESLKFSHERLSDTQMSDAKIPSLEKITPKIKKFDRRSEKN